MTYRSIHMYTTYFIENNSSFLLLSALVFYYVLFGTRPSDE